MKLAADYRALARDALRGRWKTAVLAGLLASALGANIVNATGNITSNANRANQNSNITPDGSLELFSQANGGRLLAVLVACIVVWTLFTLVVGGAVRLGYARFNLNLADGKAAAVSDLFSQKGRLWDGFCLKFLQGLYVALWSLLLVIPGIVKSYSYAMAPYIMAEHPALTANEAITAMAYVLSAETGLIGYPERLYDNASTSNSQNANTTKRKTQTGWKVTFLMNGHIQANDYVMLSSKLATGAFRVSKIDTKGDSEGSGEDSWVCVAELLEVK